MIDEKLTDSFWIDDFKIDPYEFVMHGPRGEIPLEPKVMNVLIALSENQGQTVSRDVLMDKVWAVEFGSDESLTRAISVLRKNFDDGRGRHTVIETIPRKGYKLVGQVSLVGPITQSRTDNSEIHGANSSALNPSFLRKWVSGLIAIVALISIGGVILQNNKAPTSGMNLASGTADNRPVMRDRVLISALKTQSADTDINELIASFGPQMTSLMSANGILTTLDDNADNFWQEFDLEGNVQARANRLQVTVRFIDHRTQSIIWSVIFERPRDQPHLFGDEIAAKTAAVIGCILRWRGDSPNAKIVTLLLYANFCDAYILDKDAYLGHGYTALTGRIYRADPENPKAIELHAWALGKKARYSNTITDPQGDALKRESDDLIRKALKTNPDGSFVKYLQASLRPNSGNWAEAEALILPMVSQYGMWDFVYRDYGHILRSVGRNTDAASVFERAITANPADMFATTRLGWLYITLERMDKAETQFEVVDRYYPDYSLLRIRRRQRDVFFGDKETAREYLDDNPPADPFNTRYLNHCHTVYLRFKWFEPADSDALLAACKNEALIWKARYLTGIGDIDRAYEFANAYDWADNKNQAMLLFYPDMAPFRADPRFWSLAEKIGLVDYWQETDKWPDFCDTDDLPLDCKTATMDITKIAEK